MSDFSKGVLLGGLSAAGVYAAIKAFSAKKGSSKMVRVSRSIKLDSINYCLISYIYILSLSL
jgi:hypothetical protein